MAIVRVHDVPYELPESFTLKEMRVMERYSGGHTGEGYEISQICATIHVAIMRAKPELSFEEIQEVVDELPADELDAMFETVKAAGQSPPAEKTSESGESSNGDSGTTSVVPLANATQAGSGSPDLGFSAFHRKGSAS